MARTSDGKYDRVITLRIITADGDPQFWDWEYILFGAHPMPNESVSVIRVEEA